MTPLNHQPAKDTRQLQIVNTVANMANEVAGIVKKMPTAAISKYCRNVFLKSYHRRPMTKKNTGKTMALLTASCLATACQIATIATQPIPKKINSGSTIV